MSIYEYVEKNCLLKQMLSEDKRQHNSVATLRDPGCVICRECYIREQCERVYRICNQS